MHFERTRKVEKYIMSIYSPNKQFHRAGETKVEIFLLDISICSWTFITGTLGYVS